MPEGLADTYYGFLPCADCPGISYTLELQKNGRYHLLMDYYDRESTFESDGKYTYEEGKLKLYTDNNVTGQFEFEGEKLIHLDGDGNRITTDLAPNYILYKGDASRAEMPENFGMNQDSYLYKGTGNEPFWMVQITKNNSLYFKGLMEKEMEFEVPIDESTVSEDHRTLTYSGKDGAHALVVRIIHEQCQDNMSGFYFPTTLQVKLTLDGKTHNLNGCGEFIGKYGLNGLWKLDKIDEMDVSSSPITLSINLTESRISGHAGCNRYFGTIGQVTQNTIGFNEVGSTKMACPDMSLEDRFLKFLTRSDIQWAMDENGQLVLGSESGQFVFSRTDKS